MYPPYCSSVVIIVAKECYYLESRANLLTLFTMGGIVQVQLKINKFFPPNKTATFMFSFDNGEWKADVPRTIINSTLNAHTKVKFTFTRANGAVVKSFGIPQIIQGHCIFQLVGYQIFLVSIRIPVLMTSDAHIMAGIALLNL